MIKKLFLGVLGMISALTFVACGGVEEQPQPEESSSVVASSSAVQSSNTQSSSAAQSSKAQSSSAAAQSSIAQSSSAAAQSSSKAAESSSTVVNQYEVVVNSDSSMGTVTGAGKFDEGTSVTLTATPKDGYTFLGYFNASDNRVTETAVYTFTLTADTTLTAKWVAQKHTFSVEIINVEEGVESGTVDYTVKESYATGEAINLTATPLEGYQFDGWYIEDTRLSPDAEFEFKMLPQNTVLKAVFAIKQCKVQVLSNIEDSATYSLYITEGDDIDLDTEFDYSTVVTLKVTPETGMNFVGLYTVDEEGNPDEFLTDQTTYEIELTEFVQAYYAKFEAELVTVDVSLNNIYGGTITIDPIETEYAYKSTISLSIELEDGFTLSGWYIGNEVLGRETSLDYVVRLENNNIEAIVIPETVSVSFTNANEGYGVINTEAGDYDYMSTITVKATTNDGYIFDGWYDENDNMISEYAEFEYQIDTLDSVTLVAKFAKDEFDVAVSQNIAAAGSVTGNTGTQEYLTEITLEASTNTGYSFVGWFDIDDVEGEEGYDVEDALETNPKYTFTLSYENVEIVAVWARLKYTIFYNTNGGQTQKDGAVVKYGIKNQLEVPTRQGFEFTMWYVNDSEFNKIAITDNEGLMLEEYTKTEGMTVIANWIPATVYAYFDTDGGSDVPTQPITYNNKVSEPSKAPSKTGYEFAGWYDEKGVEWNWNQQITEDTTLYAHWNILSYDLTIQSANDSIVTVNSSDSGTYEFGTVVQLEASILDGYTFTGWFVNGATDPISTYKSYPYVITAEDVTIVAGYVINNYNVTLTYNNEQGSVSGDDVYEFNSKVTVTVTPKDGYRINRYIVNGEFVYESGSTTDFYVESSYIFNVPAKDVNIEVEFAYIIYDIEVVKNVEDGNEPHYAYSDSTTAYAYHSGRSSWDRKIYFFAEEITGYTFVGWYYYGTDEMVAENATSLICTNYERIASAIKVEARYEFNNYALIVNEQVNGKVNNIAKYINDGTTDNRLQYKSEIDLNAETKSGYTFVGWYLEGGSTPLFEYEDYTYTIPAEDTTVVAVYEINSYEVILSMNSGNDPFTIVPGEVNISWSNITESIENEDCYVFDYLTNITFEVTSNTLGYVWDGWYFKGSKQTDSTKFTFTLGADDYVIEARWTPVTYTLYYQTDATIANGQPGAYVNNGDYFTLSTASKTDSEFGGWYALEGMTKIALTDPNGSSLSYFDIARLADSNNIIYIRPYWGTKVLNVQFNSNGGSPVTTKQVEYNNLVERPADPTKTGYTFDDWYIGDTNTKWDFDVNKVEENITLTAHWNINSYYYTINLVDAWGTLYYETSTGISGTLSGSNDNVALYLVFGTSIHLKASPYKGREFTAFEYSNVNDDDFYFDEEMDDEFLYGCDTEIYCLFDPISSMRYFRFSSDFDELTIDGVFGSYSTITSLIIPEIVDRIAEGALANLTKLQELTLPYTGTEKYAEYNEKIFGYIFGTTSGTGLQATTQKYIDDVGAEVAAETRYIPSSLKKVTITDEEEIYPYAFYGVRVVDVVLEEGVEIIGTKAFCSCIDLVSISLPDTLRRIETKAFYCNYALANVVIPNENMEYIANEAFKATTHLVSITLPFVGSSYTATGKEALFGWIFGTDAALYMYSATQSFSGNATDQYTSTIANTLTTIVINPNEDKTFKIGYGAFMNLTSVKNITIGKTSDGYIPEYAFCGCTNLVAVDGTILDNLRAIKTHAFDGCSSYKSFVLENSSVYKTDYRFYISTYAFKDCTSLQTVNVKTMYFDSVGEGAFQNCSSLTSFTGSVETRTYLYFTIGTRAFQNCSSLASIKIQYLDNCGPYSFHGCTSLKTASLTNIYRCVGSHSFEDCTSLTSVTLSYTSNSGTNYQKATSPAIGDFAFRNCHSLESFTIPKNNVNYIGYAILNGCYNLTYISAPFIGSDANCGSLTAPNSNYLYGYWFGIDSETDNGVEDEMYIMTHIQDGDAYIIPGTELEIHLTKIKDIPMNAFADVYEWSYNTTYVYIDGYDTSVDTHAIKASAFQNCYSITLICTVSGLTTIEESAFINSSYQLSDEGMSVLTMNANTLTSIGELAFADVNATAIDLVIPANVTIGDSAFDNAAINSVVIGKNAVLGSHIFDGITNVTNVLYDGTAAEYAVAKGSWASDWFSGSKIVSITTSDNQTYLLA